MKAVAEKIINESYDGSGYEIDRYTLADKIVAALVAERLRCASLCLRVGSPEWSEDTNSGYELAAREIAEDIMGSVAASGHTP